MNNPLSAKKPLDRIPIVIAACLLLAAATSCRQQDTQAPTSIPQGDASPSINMRDTSTPGNRARHNARFSFDLNRAQELPPGSAKDLYVDLRARASQGDAEAGRQLFLVLNECRTALQDRALPDNTDAVVDPDLLAASGMTREAFLDEQNRQSLLSTERTLRQCEELPAGALHETGHWLTSAAKAGDIYAQLAYFNYRTLIVGNAQEQMASPERNQKFNEDALRYLQDLADSGYPDGLFSLGSAYEIGAIAEKDLIQAYAYKRAAGELTPIGGNATALDLLAKGMSPDQVMQANALAKSLVERSKR